MSHLRPVSFLAATIQFKPAWGRPGENRQRILRLMEAAVSRSAQVIILPEMCTTGYVFDDRTEILPYCEAREGETFQAMAEFCRRHGVFLVYGYAEMHGEKLYNSQNLVDPAGLRLATYRKMHLYEQDYAWAFPGDTGFVTADTELGRLGLGICMDLNFEDFARFHKAQNTRLICFSACWLDEGIEIAPYWQQRLRGYANTICIANSFGSERGVQFRGQSTVIRDGHVVAAAGLDGEQIILTRI